MKAKEIFEIIKNHTPKFTETDTGFRVFTCITQHFDCETVEEAFVKIADSTRKSEEGVEYLKENYVFTDSLKSIPQDEIDLSKKYGIGKMRGYSPCEENKVIIYKKGGARELDRYDELKSKASGGYNFSQTFWKPSKEWLTEFCNRENIEFDESKWTPPVLLTDDEMQVCEEELTQMLSKYGLVGYDSSCSYVT